MFRGGGGPRPSLAGVVSLSTRLVLNILIGPFLVASLLATPVASSPGPEARVKLQRDLKEEENERSFFESRASEAAHAEVQAKECMKEHMQAFHVMHQDKLGLQKKLFAQDEAPSPFRRF